MMIREYLKLARSFNAVLTGVSPVMGAIAMGYFDIPILFVLFLIGFFGHTYGFVLNDIIDYNIDKSSKEISDRPLISGTISIKKAWIFAILSMAISFALSFYISFTTSSYFPILILAISAIFVTLYDLISKKIPGTDIILAIGVFFLVLYGAATVKNSIDISQLAWIVCILGGTQVLYMNAIAAGLKDIENDYNKGANTLAVKLGVRVTDSKLKMSTSFKTLAFAIQIIDLIVVLLPFFIIWKLESLQYAQLAIIVFIGIIMLVLSNRLLSMKTFDRMRARKLIGSHYMINFMIVPIMLMTVNTWAGILIIFPGLGFILSNLILHGTLLQPKTM